MMTKYFSISKRIERLRDWPPLFFRLVLAYGFYKPAMMKWSDIDGIAQWFGSMHYPFPTINAYLAATTETAGFILLTLGLATRLISVPLMVVMLVAIFTVHIGNGFEAGQNGFEIPFYYLLMLFSLFVNGAGKFSFDAWLERIFSREA